MINLIICGAAGRNFEEYSITTPVEISGSMEISK